MYLNHLETTPQNCFPQKWFLVLEWLRTTVLRDIKRIFIEYLLTVNRDIKSNKTMLLFLKNLQSNKNDRICV